MLKTSICCFAICLLLGLSTTAFAKKQDLPESTPEGLELVRNSDLTAVYVRPGASLEAYSKVYLLDAYVAFAKNWQRDFNRDSRSLSHRISDSQMEDIKTKVSAEFGKVFTERLQEAGYEIAEGAGPDVMVVRPAIINLAITAPDLKTPDMSQSFVREAGSLSLYAELYDSVTSDKFAQILDNEVAGDYGFAQRASSVSNKAALDQVLRRWADLLVKRLDEAHSAGSE